ncbi:MAG: GxxExxY protein [Chitinophagaceae bacterium]|nr:GxxExxY protein [Chitinophagaceae bacterium]
MRSLRLDVLVEDTILVELKSVETLLAVHEAQLLTYMKLLEKPKGILINFNCTNIFREGQKTLVNHLFAELPFC